MVHVSENGSRSRKVLRSIEAGKAGLMYGSVVSLAGNTKVSTKISLQAVNEQFVGSGR